MTQQDISVEADVEVRLPIYVTTSVYKGKDRLSARHFFTPREEPDKVLPTKKGVNVLLEDAPRLAEAILEAYNLATGKELAIVE